MSNGRFIVLEGIDGAGTTTQLRMLSDRLSAAGHKIHSTREPSDGPIGNLLRGVLSGRIRMSTSAGGGPLDQRAIALLFAADRLDHLTSEIEPALLRGFHVITDRYLASSIAYQSLFAPTDWVSEINAYASSPDLTVLLDVDPKIALGRMQQGRVGEELYERLELLEKIASTYRSVAAGSQDRFLVLDGTAPIPVVTQRIVDELCRRFPEFA